MSTRSNTRISKRLKTKGTLPLLTRRNPGKGIWVLREIITRDRRRQGRDGRRILDRSNCIIGGLLLPLLGQFHLLFESPLFLLYGYPDFLDVEDTLHRNLQDQEHAQHLVSYSLVAFADLPGEDVSKAPEAFGQVVVRARKVKGGNTQRIDGGERSDRVEILEDIFLDAQFRKQRTVIIIFLRGFIPLVVIFIIITERRQGNAWLLCRSLPLLPRDAAFQFRTQPLSERGEHALQGPGNEDAAQNIPDPPGKRG